MTKATGLIIIRLMPHPIGSAKAVVSLYSAENDVSNNETKNLLKVGGDLILVLNRYKKGRF